jgi:ubiquinol-cytochrome c reductase cytochrome b subunit
MIRRLLLALDDRLGSAPWLKEALKKAFPDHWSFMLGELALYAFVFLLASGTYMAFFFHPSDTRVTYHGPVHSLDGRTMSAAYASVLKLSFETQAGLLIRQAHHWAAVVMVAAIVVHACRVFFTGAFRKPRDLNYLVGLTLLMLAILEGFTGYSLPGDSLSGAGLRIADSIALSIPLLGSWISFLFFGGRFPSNEITSRLFPIHILFIPLAILGLVTAHMMILWHQKHTQFPGERQREDNVVGSPLWPQYTVKTLALLLTTFGVLLMLGGLVQINPVWEYGPYDPWTVASPAQPDWYVGWLEGALRLAPRWVIRLGDHSIGSVFWPGVALPAGLFGILYLWPAIERFLTRDREEHHLLQFPWQNPLRMTVGVYLLSFVGLLLAAGSDDVQARLAHIDVQSLAWAYRAAVIVLPPIAAAFAWRICRELQARHEEQKPHRVVLVRSLDGGYEEERSVPTP